VNDWKLVLDAADIVGWSVQNRMLGEKPFDLAGHLQLAVRDEYQVVRNTFELGDDMGGEEHRESVFGDRGQDQRHEVVPCQRIESGERLVEHKEIGVASERQRKRELGLLTTGELAYFVIRSYLELVKAPLGECRVEAPVQVAGNDEHRSNRKVLM
jgi:hypothetical protein